LRSVTEQGCSHHDEAGTGFFKQVPTLDLDAPGSGTSVGQKNYAHVDGVLQQVFGSSPSPATALSNRAPSSPPLSAVVNMRIRLIVSNSRAGKD